MSEPSLGATARPHRSSGKLFWPLLVVCTYVGLGIVARHADPYLDDAFIYFRVVRHVLAGLGPVFNAGDEHTVLTSPLWTYLLALGKLIAPSAEFPQIAKVSAAMYVAGAGVCAGLLLRRHVGWTAGFAALAVALTPVVLGRAGMGISLTLLTCLATMWAFQERKHPALVGVLLGLAYLSRGECVFLGPLMAASSLWEQRASRETLLAALRYLTLTALAASAVALVWHAYYYYEFRSFLPETLRAKIFQGARDWPLYSERVGDRLELATRGRGLFAASACIGAWWLAPRLPLLFAWPLAHYVAYAWLGVAFYGWYYYDIELVATLCCLFGAVRVTGWIARWIARRPSVSPALAGALNAALALLAVALLFPPFAEIKNVYSARSESLATLFVPRLAPLLAWDRTRLRGRGKVYWSAAQWLNANASGARPKSFLVDEIGVMGYYCPDWEIRDTVGLATPLHDAGELLDMDLHVYRQQPSYILQIGSELAPRLTFTRADSEPMHYVLAHKVTLGGQRARAGWYVRSLTR